MQAFEVRTAEPGRSLVLTGRLDVSVTADVRLALAAAVLHGGVIGELCRQVVHSDTFAFIHADNGSISSIVEFAGGHRLLRSFNDIAHLA